MDIFKRRDEISSKLKEVIERKGNDQFVKIFFSEPVDVPKFRKYDVQDVIFRTVFNTSSGLYVNTRKSNRGWDFWGVMSGKLDKIDRIVLVDPKKPKSHSFADLRKKVYDKETWTSLTEESTDYFKFDGRFKFRSISTIFPKYTLQEIELAFKEKKSGNWFKYGTKRDFSVETKYENGEFKAWFSSEYSGCGNGDYYLLLNPTTAVFCETD